MTDLELIFSMLGEAATTEITRMDDAKGFHENKTAARKASLRKRHLDQVLGRLRDGGDGSTRRTFDFTGKYSTQVSTSLWSDANEI